MRRLTTMTLLAIIPICLPPRVGLSQRTFTSRKHGVLLLKLDQLQKGARIVGFDIDMGAGAFESITAIPSGWRLTIDNNVSGHATLQAHAALGSGAIDEATFRNIELGVEIDNTPDTTFDVSGYFFVASDFQTTKRLPFSSYSFNFVERYPRHRLYLPK